MLFCNAKSVVFTPKVYFSYEYGDLLTVAKYGLFYNEFNYTNSSLKSSLNIVHRINLQITNYWPRNLIFGNDFEHTYNSNISDNFKKDVYLWNTSLFYLFFDKKMTLKLKVYDFLNQSLSAINTISPKAIHDEENTVLKRYAMFSMVYKMGTFGGKVKPLKNL